METLYLIAKTKDAERIKNDGYVKREELGKNKNATFLKLYYPKKPLPKAQCECVALSIGDNYLPEHHKVIERLFIRMMNSDHEAVQLFNELCQDIDDFENESEFSRKFKNIQT